MKQFTLLFSITLILHSSIVQAYEGDYGSDTGISREASSQSSRASSEKEFLEELEEKETRQKQLNLLTDEKQPNKKVSSALQRANAR